MNIAESIPHVRNYFPSCDWKSQKFSWKKSFICSVLANLAYSHISDYELENTKNVNVIPSSEYMDSIQYYKINKKKKNIRDVLREGMPEASVFIIETEHVVVVAVKINDVVFVSLRGTEFFNINDWKINLNPLKSSPPLFSDTGKVKFHRGFYAEVISFKRNLERKILEKFGNNITIYITGHSLGGALSGILYSLWKTDKYQHFYFRKEDRNIENSVYSAYTFGMPRYANIEAIALYPCAYNVINAKDIIPKLPPRALGYENNSNRIFFDTSFVYNKRYTGKLRYLKKFMSLAILKKGEHHSIETYVKYNFDKTCS
jgi:predicted lipase